jgi:hypothetical protein
MGPILTLIGEAAFVLIAVRSCNDPSRDETQPGAVAFALSGSSKIYVIYPRSNRTLGVCEQIRLFNSLYQKTIYALNSKCAKMTLKRLGSMAVTDLVDAKQRVLATTRLKLAEWLQKNLGGARHCYATTDDIFWEPEDSSPGALFHLVGEVTLLTKISPTCLHLSSGVQPA